ncbi:hypothetical protein [Salinarimonas soli]|uniref:Uncharacterized protein n=1 Tax=Salinarimonas soli TaxID=1638099 RepID=A0A5B2VEV5_9HYPH|nr:hypothetical protein [Salinarimonas soli]KAA2237651.1 hypothetical protein F0L46_08195 [Salinarimonas soli]
MLALIARFFGIQPATAAFAIGALLMLPGAFALGYGVGEWTGYDAGRADTIGLCQANDLRRKLAEAKRDLTAAQQSAESHRRAADQRAEQARTAEEKLDAYERELAARAAAPADPQPPAPVPAGDGVPACRPAPRDGLTRRDLEWLRVNHYGRADGPGQPRAAAPGGVDRARAGAPADAATR